MNRVKTADGIELELSLALSTRHLSPCDDKRLHKCQRLGRGQADLEMDHLWLRDNEYGWHFVNGAANQADSDADLHHLLYLGFHQSLGNTLRYCFDRGIRSCNFDADGDTYDCFPVYDWSSPQRVVGTPEPSVVRNNPSTLLTLVAE